MPLRGGLSTLQSGLSKVVYPVCFRWFLLPALTALQRGQGTLFLLGEDLVQVDRAALQDLYRDFVALLIGAGQAVALVVQDVLQNGAQLRLDVQYSRTPYRL